MALDLDDYGYNNISIEAEGFGVGYYNDFWGFYYTDTSAPTCSLSTLSGECTIISYAGGMYMSPRGGKGFGMGIEYKVIDAAGDTYNWSTSGFNYSFHYYISHFFFLGGSYLLEMAEPSTNITCNTSWGCYTGTTSSSLMIGGVF